MYIIKPYLNRRHSTFFFPILNKCIINLHHGDGLRPFWRPFTALYLFVGINVSLSRSWDTDLSIHIIETYIHVEQAEPGH